MSIVISLDADDFERLFVSSSRRPARLDEYPERFRDPATDTYPDLSRWAYVYWFDQYAHLILARSYLNTIGQDYQVVSDEYMEDAETHHGLVHHVHDPGWVIFTDWASPCWTRHYEPVPAATTEEHQA